MKNSTFKNLLTIIAVFLVSILTFGFLINLISGSGLFSFGEALNGETDAGETSSVLISESEDNGISIMSNLGDKYESDITNADTEVYTITASFTPTNANDTDVTMSLSWADSSSTWASGKTVTDYVTVTQATSGSAMGTLTCLQAFGEQIILTVASVSDNSVYSTATVDYVARVSGMAIGCVYSGNSSSGTYSSSYTRNLYFGTTDCLYPVFQLSVGTGTVYGDFDCSFTIDLCPEDSIHTIGYYIMTNGHTSRVISTSAVYEYDCDNSFTLTKSDDYSFEGFINDSGEIFTITNFYSLVKMMYPTSSDVDLKTWYSLYYADLCSSYASQSSEYYFSVLLNYTYSYDGKQYSSGQICVDTVGVDPESLVVPISGIDLDNSSITF